MAQIDAAHARTKQISSSNQPQLSASASYTRIDPTVSVDLPFNGKTQTFSFAPNDNYNASVTLQQMLYDFGKSSSAIAASEANERSAKDNIDLIKNAIAYQVIQYYFGVLAIEETIAIEEQQKVILRGNLGVTAAREKQGTALSLDHLSTETKVATIESQEADLRASLEKQKAALRRLFGWKPGTPIALKKTQSEPTAPSGLDELLSRAKQNRPEFLLAHDAEEASRLQIEAARMSSPPSLAANITAGIKDGYPPSLTKPYPNWAGTVVFSLPILEGGRTQQRVAEAEANYVGTQAQTTDLAQQVEAEVESANADVEANRAKLLLTKVQIDQAQQALTVADVRYKNGAATNLDFLTAQSALEQAQLQEATTRLNYALSVYNLKRALGEKQW
jgi:outer membrane protein